MKDNGMCANCGQPRVDGSTLCADCLPDDFLRATGKTARVMKNPELIISEQKGVIEALKASNQEKQVIIDDLMEHGFEQNRKICAYEKQIEKLLIDKHTVIF